MVKMVTWSTLSREEQALLVLIQGVLNRKGHSIFVDIDIYKDFLDEPYEIVTIKDILDQYYSEFDGLISYTFSHEDIGINLAATLCAKYNFLAVPNQLLDTVKEYKIKYLGNLDDLKGNRAERQRFVFNKVKDKLNNDGLVHQVVKDEDFQIVLRDFAISQRWATIYTSENKEDREFREEILRWLKPNSPIFGWNDNEIEFVKHISVYGCYCIPSDWSSNHSYFTKKQYRIHQKTKRENIRENKHYLAIVVSDGDNIQWLERDFLTTSTFGQRQKSPLDYKITWTFSPSLGIFSPDVAAKIYETPKHDYFITGVSGIGYANLMSYPIEFLDKFTENTKNAMENCDLSVVCMLDNINDFGTPENVEKRLYSYAKYDQIKGGIWEIDPDRYNSGKGRIWYSNDKPFISVRHSLWFRHGVVGDATKEFLDTYIEAINNSRVSPNTEDGYTVLNVHPWSISIENLDYVIRNLKDHIELVYADELIELVRKNILKK